MMAKSSAAEPELVQRVRAALSELSDVVERRMFGGTAFMVNGKMCVTARAERIMCRIDPRDHDSALGEPGASEVVMRGRVYRGYIHILDDAVRTTRDLDRWLQRALLYNATLNT
jgi:TfoX/Sxy family transcriptional regulator of competence genes